MLFLKTTWKVIGRFRQGNTSDMISTASETWYETSIFLIHLTSYRYLIYHQIILELLASHNLIIAIYMYGHKIVWID